MIENEQQKIRRNLRREFPGAKRKLRILLAEDDAEMRNLLVGLLRERGYQVIECSDGFEVFKYLNGIITSLPPRGFDLIISDIRMPGFAGLGAFEGVMKYDDCPPIILITAFGDRETHEKAKEIGVIEVFDKPFEMDDLLAKIREVAPN